MCDWPAYGGASRCGNDGSHRMGPLLVCNRHLDVLLDGVLDAMRAEARWMIDDGRATPGGMEAQMRHVLAGIDKRRRPARYAIEGRAACVYFVQRADFVKIGSTVDLAIRLKALEYGGSMIRGMTAGPVRLLATIPGGIEEERELHARFLYYRVDGRHEWFRYEGLLRKYVEGLIAKA